MTEGESKVRPVKDGLWEESPDGIFLLGSRCNSCGEIHFPKIELGMCPQCQGRNLKTIKLSRKGRIYSVVTVMQRPPEYYLGPVPYSIGYVELPEGVRVETIYSHDSEANLKIGAEVELVIEKLYRDEEGTDIITYMFRPIEDRSIANAGT